MSLMTIMQFPYLYALGKMIRVYYSIYHRQLLFQMSNDHSGFRNMAPWKTNLHEWQCQSLALIID